MNFSARVRWYYIMGWFNQYKWELAKIGVYIALGFVVAGIMGCANAEPYAKVGVHHMVIPYDAPNPAFIGELGVQWDKTSCQWTHLSMITEGAPFNDRPELSVDTIGCSYTFGGK